MDFKLQSKLTNKKADYWSIILSIYIIVFIVVIFTLLSSDFIHWFIIPIMISGVIITIDAIDWIRKKIDTFDPVGFIGLFGFHFFFLAPLLQIYLNYGMTYVIPPDDWRPWLGGMAIINMFGLIIYRYTRRIAFKRFRASSKNVIWILNKRVLLSISIPSLIIMGVLQLYVYYTQGGIISYITSYTERAGSFEGMGWIFAISESFPIVGIILLATFLRNSKYKKSYFMILNILIIFFLIRMIFGGLRGSRSNTIWAMIWAVGIIHFWIRPISRKFIYVGLAFLFSFIYIYGIYKGAGLEVIEAIKDSESREEIAEESGRGIETVLLGDLSRTNVQAFILYRLHSHPSEYSLALGRSYLGDMSILIPKRIWPDRPPTKVKEGTEIIRGEGSYNPNGYVSSRIYGLTGEFMLNFGYVFAPLVFIVLGIFVAKVKSFLCLFDREDSRLLIYPFLIVCCFLLLVQDLDNLIFSIFKNLLIPFIIVWMSSNKIYLEKSNLPSH